MSRFVKERSDMIITLENKITRVRVGYGLML